jgi:hypothetical protein
MSEPAVRRLLHGLASHDAGLLLSVYHPQASYTDPVHPDIRGARLGWLIRYRLAHFEHLQGEPLWIRGDERKGQMQWRLSWRRRGATGQGRLTLLTTFSFWEDAIVRQVDEFQPWACLRQTRGLSGLALGWLPGRLSTEQRRAAAGLDRFIQRQAPQAAVQPTAGVTL